MYSSCFFGSCEVRLRLIGGSAATTASGCSGAFAEACCMEYMSLLACAGDVQCPSHHRHKPPSLQDVHKMTERHAMHT